MQVTLKSVESVPFRAGARTLAEGDFDLVIEGVLGADMGALGIGVGTEWSGGARKRPERALGQPGRGSGKGQSLCRERYVFSSWPLKS